jgi:hypothetical protein
LIENSAQLLLSPFAKATAGGSWIKLRSRDVAQKGNDPDLQVFGGNLADNNEHNYGWNACDYQALMWSIVMNSCNDFLLYGKIRV